MNARPSILLMAIGSTVIVAPCVQSAPFDEVASEVGVYVESNSFWGAGVAFLDYDGDGDLDIHVVDGEGDPNVLFRNNGNRDFTEVAGTAGLANTSWGKAIVPADYDNDGDADLLLTTYGPSEINYLYRNNGNGTFTNVTAGSGFGFAATCTGAAWADYDGDGRLDCFITVYDGDHKDRLLRNLGGGVFQDVAQSLGLQDPTGWGYQPAWFDYDGDADPDLYVANDNFFGGSGNKLFRNNGNGTFTDVSASTGAGVVVSAMGLAVGDYDNDLDLDLYVTNLPAGNVFLRNDSGIFTNVADDLGVSVNNICWGADFFDYDNDTRLDLYVDVSDENGNPHEFGPGGGGREQALRGSDGAPNKLFRNVGPSGFQDVSATSGTDNAGVSYCSAVGDYDEDGDLDLYVTNFWFTIGDEPCAFYENQHVPRGNSSTDWLRIKLIGTVSNRDAVGAQVWIRTANGWQLRERLAGTGYLSASEPILHLARPGDARDALVRSLALRAIESYRNIPSGQTLTLVEGDGSTTSVEEIPTSSSDWRLSSVFPNPMIDRTEIRLQMGSADGRLELIDAHGRLQRSMLLPSLAQGEVVVSWDGTNDEGRPLPAGSYFLRLAAGTRALSGPRIVLLHR